MTSRSIVVIVAGCGAMLLGCAGAARQHGKARTEACFRPADTYSFAVVDDHTVNLRANVHDDYQLTLQTECRNIDWDNNIALRSRSGGGWICDPLDAELIAPGPAGPRHCEITAIRKLSPEEVATLPSKQKP